MVSWTISSVPAAFTKGLRDIGASVSFMAAEKLKLALDLHQFSSVQTTPGTDSAFGTELDLTATYAYSRVMSVSFGLSSFVPGDDFAGNNPDNAFWGYVATVVNF